MGKTNLITNAQKMKLAKSEGYIAIIGNVLLGIFKFWVGIVVNSTAIVADAIETLSDSISSCVLIVGLKISESPPDKEHPFGHGRAELLFSFIIASMMAMVGFGFMKAGIDKIIAKEVVSFGWLGFSAMIATIVVKEAMAQYSLWAARKTNMNSLVADAYHHRSDAISSAIVLVGIIATKIPGVDFWWMDGVLANIVGLMLLRLAYKTMRSTGSRLLGTQLPENLNENLKALVSDYFHGENVHLHHLKYHDYGVSGEITFHIKLDGNIKLKEAHAFVEDLEKKIKCDLHIDATIHVDTL